MGYHLAATHGLMIQLHFLNPSALTETPKVSITIRTAKPGVVTTPSRRSWRTTLPCR